MKLVQSDKTYFIPKVNVCDVGYYKCVAENVLGNASSVPEFISLVGKFTFQSGCKYFMRHPLLIV